MFIKVWKKMKFYAMLKIPPKRDLDRIQFLQFEILSFWTARPRTSANTFLYRMHLLLVLDINCMWCNNFIHLQIAAVEMNYTQVIYYITGVTDVLLGCFLQILHDHLKNYTIKILWIHHFLVQVRHCDWCKFYAVCQNVCKIITFGLWHFFLV